MGRKRSLYLLSLLSVGFAAASVTVYAASNDVRVRNYEMENSYIHLSVEQDSGQSEYLRYKLKATDGQLKNDEDNNKDLTYKYFYSGITSFRINNTDYVYGRGEDVGTPSFNAAEKCHTSAQRFGNVVIEQKLTFSEGFTKGFDDMLKISYKVLETGEGAVVGADIIIDPMLGDDDKTKFMVSDAEIKNEAFFNSSMPAEWKAEMSENSAVSAYGKLNGVSHAPNTVYFGNWNKMYSELWDYSSDINTAIDDGAVAVKWEPVQVEPGYEFTTYYGIKNYTAAPDGNDTKVIKTSSSFPTVPAALLAIAIAAAGACVLTYRKEKANEE